MGGVASTLVQTYDPAKVIVTFGGAIITGFADGTFIQVSPASDLFTKKVGADGETARAKSSDETYEVTLTLMQTSLSNKVLNAFKEADRLSSTGVLPLSITDLSGTALFFWPQAWIKKSPGGEFGKEIGDRAWAFDTGKIVGEVI
jgi:hypothetical protein